MRRSCFRSVQPSLAPTNLREEGEKGIEAPSARCISPREAASMSLPATLTLSALMPQPLPSRCGASRT
jgi:hypothetical protein